MAPIEQRAHTDGDGARSATSLVRASMSIARASHPGARARAYRYCEQLTRARAANFYYGIRLLPASKRHAMCAVYAFARRVDDIGDGSLGTDEKLRLLDAVAEALGELAWSRTARRADPVLVALADAGQRFALPADALSELVEGVRMDVLGVGYERFDELVLYCRRVAGGIGRLCLAIFGLQDPRASSWTSAAADELGVAMQLTNILRDLREDAIRGRVYLPREDLARFGLTGVHERARGAEAAIAGQRSSVVGQLAGERDASEALLSLIAQAETTRGAGGMTPARTGGVACRDGADRPPAVEPSALAGFDSLVWFEVRRAREWFARGASLLEQLDRRSSACVLAMSGIYGRLLDRIAASPGSTLQTPPSLTPPEKAWVAARSVVGV
jgi:phytoene synthase